METNKIVLHVCGDPFGAREVYIGDHACETSEDYDLESGRFEDVMQPMDSSRVSGWWQYEFIPMLKKSDITHVRHRNFGQGTYDLGKKYTSLEWVETTVVDFIQVWG